MHYHFIAIGGSVMHALALDLAAQGHKVTGSDDAIHEPSRSRLAAAGLLPKAEGWFPQKITSDLAGIVLGMHARADNPELVQAQALGLPIYSFPAFVYAQSAHKQRVVIAGSHGKTTTTALLLHVLRQLGRDTDYLLGASLRGYDRAVRLSGAPLMVLEGDEYLTSALDARPKFLHYRPQLAALTGIAWDHINVFPTFERYLEAFQDFLASMPKGGTLVYNAEDAHVVRLVKDAGGHLHGLPYQTPQYHYSPAGTVVEIESVRQTVRLFGKHNLSNLAAAHGLAVALGISTLDFLEAASSFAGADRRLEVLCQREDLTVLHDFAHAPSKVRATVAAVRERFPERDILAVLELHTFSSLDTNFLPHYAGSLDGLAAPLVVIDPEALRLKHRAPVSEGMLRQAFGKEDLQLIELADALGDEVRWRLASPNPKVLLLMSSGNLLGVQPGGLFT